VTVLRIRLASAGDCRHIPGIDILATPLDAAATPLLALLEACRSSRPCPTAAGICQDARHHPSRTVRAWMAWRSGDAVPVGLVTLVTAVVGSRPRHSVGWLLVRPDARRRGVATALVGTVIRAAGETGGGDVFAETLERWPEATAFWRRLAAADRSDG